MSLNNTVAEVVARWREYREPCPGDGISGGSLLARCALCDDTEYIQPPQVTALIEAVTTQHPYHGCLVGNGGICWFDEPGIRDNYKVGHQSCHGTGRVPRDWEEIGEGALKGRLIAVLEGFDSGTNVYSPQHELVERVKHCFDDSAALAAVDKAVMQRWGGKP